MEKPISHLTHRAITDHLAIVRNDIDKLTDKLSESIPLRGKLLREEKELIAKAMRSILSHAQELAELRRESASNE